MYMGKLLLPILLLIGSGALFFMYIDPTYKEIGELKEQNGRLDEALNKARELQASRDELRTRRNNISQQQLARLNKLLPDNIDNVRLILDVDTIAAEYGLIIKDFGFSGDAFNNRADSDGLAAPAPQAGNSLNEDGGPQSATSFETTSMEFTVTSTYENFLAFLRDLEKSLRVVDVVSIDLNAGGGEGEDVDDEENSYRLKIETYWLK